MEKKSEDKSYYLILEVEVGASDSEIKKNYYRLARLYHPDKNPNDQQAAEKVIRRLFVIT